MTTYNIKLIEVDSHMNTTVAMLLQPLSLWIMPISVPLNVTAVVIAYLPQFCNATGVYELTGPTAMYITCVNTAAEPIYISGWVSTQIHSPPPPSPQTISPPLLETALAVTAAAGLSHLFSNHRKWLAAPIVLIARLKTADAPIRRQILEIVNNMGAATLAQIAKALGKSWGAVQWHIYVLERESRLKSIKIGAFTYYYTNPRMAAEVILASVDPDTLTPEEREKLEFMTL